jgi:phage terminase large subunit-like protein
MTFREVLLAAGLENNKHYKENRANRWFEFNDGSWVFFKTADDPDSLRGAGLDILWIDEAAFIPTDDAWNVVRPALSEKEGIVITTTTPADRNWFHELFWSKEAVADPRQGRVEYWSIDNPYFPVDEWKYAQQTMHPLLFAREFCASFDAMAGIELSGDWLHYYADTADDKNNVITIPRDKDNRPVKLDYYIGVDPAISLKDTADKFAMACIGVAKDTGQVFLIDTFASRVPFSEQLDLIAEWHHRFHPHLIGIESIAYQAALAQQAVRLPNLPPILPIFSRGKKSERILSMAPLFRIGKVRIRRDHRDFIDEWVNYDTAPKNPRDDLLDAVEIALKAAGALLPASEDTPLMIPYGFSQNGSQSLDELAWSSFSDRQSKEPFDPELGTVW